LLLTKKRAKAASGRRTPYTQNRPQRRRGGAALFRGVDGPFLGGPVEGSLRLRRVPVGRVPEADRPVPVAGGQAPPVAAPRDARVEAVVAGARRRAAQGEGHLPGGDVPQMNLDPAGGGESAT